MKRSRFQQAFAAVIAMASTVFLIAASTQADNTSQVEGVITDVLVSYGWSPVNLLFSVDIAFDSNYALANTQLGSNGAAAREFLLSSANGTWTIVGTGGGKMTYRLLVDGYKLSPRTASALLGGCVPEPRHSGPHPFVLIRHPMLYRKKGTNKAVVMTVYIKVQGHLKKVRFAEPTTSKICLL